MQTAAPAYYQTATLIKPVYSEKNRHMKKGANYSYFGARYYDSDLSVWLSVDPLSDKYPNLSPYMYCGGNPINYFDPDGNKIIAVGDISKYYLKSYLNEHFGNSKVFKVNGSGELKYNQKKYDKFYSNATEDQKTLMSGLKEAIDRTETAQVHINQSESEKTFELSQIIPGTNMENTRGITTDKAAVTIGPSLKFPDYYILINNEAANKEPLTAGAEKTTSNKASAAFFHEALDEFLNYYTKKTTNDGSSQREKVSYHNAALRNIKLEERDGLDHQ